MAEGKKSAEEVAADPLAESTEDSEAYTEQRTREAADKLAVQQEQARQQFVFLGVPEPDIEIPSPEDRPIDTETMTDAEIEALNTQNEIASENYQPRNFHDFVEESFDSPDINPEAKEFQLPKTGAPDEYTGPDAADKAAASGFNPRAVATSTNPDGLVGFGDDENANEIVKELTGRSADDIREEQGGVEPAEAVDEDKGSGADETAPRRATKVSKSSPDDAPNRIEK